MAPDNKGEVEGAGLGFRLSHAEYILEKFPSVSWFEILFDNFRPHTREDNCRIIEGLASSYPLTLHCVGMNLGSSDPIDFSYLEEVRRLKRLCQAKWVSDHLCWTALDSFYHHDLLPFPYTERMLNRLSERIDAVQNFLGEQILVENIASYLEFTFSEMEEFEFLNLLCQKTDCRLLLDINNIYVNAYNHGRDAAAFLAKISKERVAQYHLAGHEVYKKYLLDSHGQPVCKEVWRLFGQALEVLGPRPVSIERDANIPSFLKLYKELQKAQAFYQN